MATCTVAWQRLRITNVMFCELKVVVFTTYKTEEIKGMDGEIGGIEDLLEGLI